MPRPSPLLDATAWQEAFDASGTPSLTHVLGSTRRKHRSVYASLRSLYQAEIDSVSVSSLQDVLMPVSTLGSRVTVRASDPGRAGVGEGPAPRGVVQGVGQCARGDRRRDCLPLPGQRRALPARRALHEHLLRPRAHRHRHGHVVVHDQGGQPWLRPHSQPCGGGAGAARVRGGAGGVAHARPPRRPDELTRKPLVLWDRVKILAFLLVAFGVLIWAQLSSNPLMTPSEAERTVAQTGLGQILLVLVVVEWPASDPLPAGRARVVVPTGCGCACSTAPRGSPTGGAPGPRYRVARVLKWTVGLVLTAMVLSAVSGLPPIQAIFQVPAWFIGQLPMILQLVLYLFIAVAQFGLIFWFLSRGASTSTSPTT